MAIYRKEDIKSDILNFFQLFLNIPYIWKEEKEIYPPEEFKF